MRRRRLDQPGPIDQRAAEFLLLGLTRTWISAATLGGPGGPRLAQVLLLAVALERVVEVPRRSQLVRRSSPQKNPGSKFAVQVTRELH